MSGVLNLLLAGAASAIKDAYFNLTTLLLNTSSTNGAQNNTFLDSSSNNFTITRNGNTTQGTFTPFSQTGWSNYFNGDVNCDLQTPSNAAFGYGTGDFCLEAYVYQQTDANARIIDHTAGAFNFGLLSTGIVTLFDGSTTHNTPSSSVSLNTWTHICATRQGSTLRLFVNGVLKYNTTFTVSKADSAVNIGSNPGGGGETLNGYISNLRIVKGGVPSAYSTSSTTNGTTVFTPSTTPLSASASLTAGSLSLLTCQSNRFVDNSANAFAISVTAGTPSVQAFSPFAPTAAYSTSVVGGSGYFDGSGDYLNFTDSANDLDLGGLVASFEAWVYPTSAASAQHFAYKHGGALSWSASNGIEYAIAFDVNKFYFVYNNGGSPAFITGATTRQPYQWHHVVVATDASNNMALFVNGVREGTATNAITKPTTRTTITIGVNVTGGEPIFGYVSGQRFIKGSGAYDPTQSTITVPTAPPTAITNTSLLLNFTNAGIYDSAAKNVLETVGNAQVSTTQAKWGTTSMYFPATNGNYFVGPKNPINLFFGTGAFTVECWVYPTAFTNAAAGIVGVGIEGGATDWNLEFNTSGNVAYIDADGFRFITSVAVSLNTWTHIAAARTSTAVTLYFNGVSVGTYSTINNIPGNVNSRLCVGTGAQVSGSRQFIGYIDDVRITKGYARYTANFTPATEAFPVQ